MNNLNNLNNQIFRDVENQPKKRLRNTHKKKLQTAGVDDGEQRRRRPPPPPFLQNLQELRQTIERRPPPPTHETKDASKLLEEENKKKECITWIDKNISDNNGHIDTEKCKELLLKCKMETERLKTNVERLQKQHLIMNKKLENYNIKDTETTVDTEPQSLDDLKKQHEEIQNILFKGTVGLNEEKLIREFERLSKLIQNHPEHKEETWKEENKEKNNTALSKIQRFIPNSEILEKINLDKLYDLIKDQLNKIKNKDGKEECKKDESNLNIEEVTTKLSRRIFKFKRFFMYLTYDSIKLGKVYGNDLFSNIQQNVLSILETRAIYAALHDVSDEKIIIESIKGNTTKGEWVKGLENKVNSFLDLDPEKQASLIEVDKLYDDLESFCKSYCAEGLFEVEKKKETYQKPVTGYQTNSVQQRSMELEKIKKLREQLKKGKEATQKLSDDAARKCNWWEKCELNTKSGGKKLSNDKSNKMFYIVQDI